MIALGADEIVMSNLSELSPIDPSAANVFNPPDPMNPQNRIPISVEDVMAYFDLAKNKFGGLHRLLGMDNGGSIRHEFQRQL